MKAKKHSTKWWALVVVHNNLVHPFLPLGYALECFGPTKPLAKAVFFAHNVTYPDHGGG